MKKNIFLILLLLSSGCYAEDLADQYFSDKKLVLTSQERAALKIGKKWQTGNATSKPVASEDGSIRYVFGSGQIQIMCAVLQVCDIALQAGEQVNNLNAGDPRFLVEPAITGRGETQRIHVLVKPLDVGLDTSLVVTTSFRTYHFRLRSSRHDFMPYVSFTYPDDVRAKWEKVKLLEKKVIARNTIPETGEYLGKLQFDYTVSGCKRFLPLRVYNDGVKTILEMPVTLSQSEAPALLVLRGSRGLFTKEETVMVNYRIQGNRYIVDNVFDKAVLIAGTGRNQERVVIKRSHV